MDLGKEDQMMNVCHRFGQSRKCRSVIWGPSMTVVCYDDWSEEGEEMRKLLAMPQHKSFQISVTWDLVASEVVQVNGECYLKLFVQS